VPTGDSTMPLNRCCSRSCLTKPRRTSLRPEHFFGSQWPRSHNARRHGNRTDDVASLDELHSAAAADAVWPPATVVSQFTLLQPYKSAFTLHNNQTSCQTGPSMICPQSQPTNLSNMRSQCIRTLKSSYPLAFSRFFAAGKDQLKSRQAIDKTF